MYYYSILNKFLATNIFCLTIDNNYHGSQTLSSAAGNLLKYYQWARDAAPGYHGDVRWCGGTRWPPTPIPWNCLRRICIHSNTSSLSCFKCTGQVFINSLTQNLEQSISYPRELVELISVTVRSLQC